MAHHEASRCRETTTTTGTGAYTLAGVVTGFRTFGSVMSEGDTINCLVILGADWEIGRYTMTGGQLARTAILASSNADNAVNWSAGTKNILSVYVGITDLDATGLTLYRAILELVRVDAQGTPLADQFGIWVDADTLKGVTAAAARVLLGIDTDGTLAANSDDKFASQKATKTYVDGLAVNLGKRQRVRAATTANITIATALNNGDSLDGLTLATGELVLVKDQTAPAENGIYVVGPSPARSTEFDTYDEHPGSLISVAEGTANLDTLWLCTSNAGGTLNTTAIAFSQLVIAGAAKTQIELWSWYVPNPSNKDYDLIVNIPYAVTVLSLTTDAESGTGTATGKINTTALGGTANAVSTSEQEQAHASANAMAIGDNFRVTLSSVSSLVGMTLTAKVQRVLA